MPEPGAEEPYQVPPGLLHVPGRRAGPRLDPFTRARQRRYVKDSVQLAWDAETDAQLMVKLVLKETKAGVIPVAKLAEQLKRKLAARVGGFGRVGKLMTEQALLTACRVLARGDVADAIDLLAPIQSLIARKPGPEDAHAVLCESLRGLFPSAPESYRPRQRRGAE